MAGGAAPKSEPSNPCCAALEKKLAKIEMGRAALKEAIALMDKKITEMEIENLNLKKACEQDQRRAELEREAKEKESHVRSELENEICNLKSEIALLQKGSCSDRQVEERDQLLRTQLLEQENEIKRLKELLEKKTKRGDSDRASAEAEKKKAAEALKLVKAEKSKTEKEKKCAETERRKAEECKRYLEALKLEANEVKMKLKSEKSKIEETDRKVEAEKQRADREKKRADSEAMKAEEQRKCAEVERQNAVNEKIRADQLSQQLEEERQRKEALQKEIQEILSAGSQGLLYSKGQKCDSVPCNDDVKYETRDKKVVHEQLKLEKMQRRHAKKIAKLEKLRNKLLKQELDLLKQDALQFSHRLNMLDERFSHGIGGIYNLTKIGDSSKRQTIDSNNRISGIELCNLFCQNENDLTKTRCSAIDAFDHFKPTGECMKNLVQFSGLSCTEPISGIDSELESLTGGSFRSKSQNFAICSTSTSFSDRQLMGSQGRGVSPIITSARLEEESSKQGLKFTRLSGEVPKRPNENDYVVAENDDRSQLALYAKNELVNKLPGCGSKRKKTQDARESFLNLDSEEKLDSRMGKMHSLVHDDSGPETKVPVTICSQGEENSQLSGRGKYLASKLLDDVHVKKCKASKKRKLAQEQMYAAQPSNPNDEQKQINWLEVEDIGDVCCNGASTSSANQIDETVHVCRDGAIDAGGSDIVATMSFEDVFVGDIMKLLELDDEADEERFRIAMERPLSPALPEISFHELKGPHVGGFNYVVEGANSGGLTGEKVNLLPSHNFDAVDVEIDSNSHHLLHGKDDTASFRPSTYTVNEKMCGTEKRYHSMDGADHSSPLFDPSSLSPISIQDSQEVPKQNHGVHCFAINTVPTAREQNDAVQGIGFDQNQVENECMEFKDLSVSKSLHDLETGEFSTEGQKNDNHALESDVEKEAGMFMPISASGQIGVHCFGNVEVNQASMTKYCVIPASKKDENSINRIICATESLSSEVSMAYVTRWVVGGVLLALAQKQNLMLEEKASVFFSLLLQNVLVMASADSKRHKSEAFSFCSESLSREVTRVVSDGETRSLFLELCECKLLISLVEDFLIDRTVLAYVESSHTPVLSSDSGSRVLLLGGRTILVSSKPATFNQLEIGGVILASICTATNEVGFICEVSYNILRMCKDDLSWMLRVLHIFASVCGNKYFSQSNCRSIMTTVKSVVLLLEGREKSVGLVSPHYLTPTRDTRPMFPPCVQCPFNKDVVCIDQILTLLLGKLEAYANSVVRCQYPRKLAFSMVGACQAENKRTEETLDNVNGVDEQSTGLSESGCLFVESIDVLKADFVADWTLSHFSDIISLVELISCYLDWDWLYNNIVPSLLKLLASHVPEEFLAAVLILIGQIGRLGIDAGGYDQIGVEGMRCSLSAFLNQTTTLGRGLSSQFSAAKALIDLLPFEFEELVKSDHKIFVESSQSNHINVIKKWFAQLSEEQQCLYLSLSQSSIVQNA